MEEEDGWTVKVKEKGGKVKEKGGTVSIEKRCALTELRTACWWMVLMKMVESGAASGGRLCPSAILT